MSELSFNAEKHEYRLDGQVVPSVSEVAGIVTGGYDPANAVIRAAAIRGTAVHELCELIDYDEMPHNIPADLAGYATAYKKFLRDCTPSWRGIERTVYSRRHGFAGRLDRIGRIPGVAHRCIVDIKTVSSISRIQKIGWAVQLAGYALANSEMESFADGGGGYGVIVALNPRGDYAISYADDIAAAMRFDAEKVFLAGLDIAKIRKGIN